MSVIGPRPGLWNQDVLIAERDKYGANDVKPGLTGWAQINGRDELEISEKARLDGEYVKNMGLQMDIKCFLGSIGVFAHDIPKNVYWQVMKFDEFKSLLDSKIGFSSSLYRPYKLCDIRPAYGDIFYDRIKMYDFWGWCDIDIIFGNIRNFITETLLNEYDKIGSLGHCVLIRNSDKMRTMYKQSIGERY